MLHLIRFGNRQLSFLFHSSRDFGSPGFLGFSWFPLSSRFLVRVVSLNIQRVGML
jgi:hypothetical protein